LLVAQRDYNGSSTSSFPAYIPAITGDVYALAAMGSEAEETVPPSALSQSTLVPLEPWNKNSRMVQAIVHKKIYQPLKGEQSAPEDEMHAHAGIFGGLDELTAPGYTSLEAFSARKKEVLTSVQTQVCLPKEDSARRNFEKMLEENVATFVCQYWTGIKVDPVHIEFLPSLPETIRCAARAYPPEISPRMQAKMEAFKEQQYVERITKSQWTSPTVLVLKKDSDGRRSSKDIRLAIDYRRPNAHIKQITLMMPDVHARIRALKDYAIFAELN